MSIEDAVASKLRVFKTRDKKNHSRFIWWIQMEWTSNSLKSVQEKKKKAYTDSFYFFLLLFIFAPPQGSHHIFFTHTPHFCWSPSRTISYATSCISIYIFHGESDIFAFFLMCFVGLRYVSINFIFFSSSVACKIVPFPFKIIFNEKNYPCSTKTDAERELNG